MNKNAPAQDLNRREFLRGGSVTSLMMMMGGVLLKRPPEVRAQEEAAQKSATRAINCAVIGCGPWGREILKTLAVVENAPIVAYCDTYKPYWRRAKESAPKAEALDDYRKVLEAKEVDAVIIATPTHRHRGLVEEALAAGKHVYCEAPLAHTIEDAKAIALAARKAFRLNFQAGLQGRSDPELHYTYGFVQTGAVGKPVMGRGQWHRKQSWRRPAPNSEREREINWHLRSESSAGIVGEIGIHHLDLAMWYFGQRPVAAMGWGSNVLWQDGRDMADTLQTVVEFPDRVNYVYHATLANSFDASYDMFHGTESAIMLRDRRAWMFKEVDSALLGWEVYAKKEAFYRETGIVLSSDATKLTTYVKGDQTAEEAQALTETALYHSLKAFVTNTDLRTTAVKDFTDNFGDDEQGLKDYLQEMAKNRVPAAGYQQGYEATVAAIKANESVAKNQKVLIGAELFEL